MSNIEKEIRFKISEDIARRIREISHVKVEPQKQIDLTLGYDGFESLANYGYVCRVRQKGKKIWMEIKRKVKDSTLVEFEEEKVSLSNFANGVRFFEKLGMKPYLYMSRSREIFEYNGLMLFIDQIDMLGTYVEIEYQDTDNAEEKISSLKKVVGIDYEPSPLYGDIFKVLLENENFKNEFDNKLGNFLVTCQLEKQPL